MNKTVLIVVGSVIGVLAILALVVFSTYVSYHDRANTMEKAIIAQYTENQNILSSYSNKVSEAVQVPDIYVDGLKSVVKEAMSGRYGDDGSQAVFQWIQEQNQQVDPAVFTKIQTIIVAGRNKFENGQTALISKKQIYTDELDTFWGKIWFPMAGYPSINLDEYKIITSEHSNNSFKSGVDSGLNLRQGS